jgi:hypothetical protein
MSVIITLKEKEILERPNDNDLGKYVRERYNHEKYVDDNSYDYCIICGKQSPYSKVTHIDDRVGYIEGGGQECFQPKICDK